jgi:hypothetical protein
MESDVVDLDQSYAYIPLSQRLKARLGNNAISTSTTNPTSSLLSSTQHYRLVPYSSSEDGSEYGQGGTDEGRGEQNSASATAGSVSKYSYIPLGQRICTSLGSGDSLPSSPITSVSALSDPLSSLSGPEIRTVLIPAVPTLKGLLPVSVEDSHQTGPKSSKLKTNVVSSTDASSKKFCASAKSGARTVLPVQKKLGFSQQVKKYVSAPCASQRVKTKRSKELTGSTSQKPKKTGSKVVISNLLENWSDDSLSEGEKDEEIHTAESSQNKDLSSNKESSCMEILDDSDSAFVNSSSASDETKSKAVLQGPMPCIDDEKTIPGIDEKTTIPGIDDEKNTIPGIDDGKTIPGIDEKTTIPGINDEKTTIPAIDDEKTIPGTNDEKTISTTSSWLSTELSFIPSESECSELSLDDKPETQNSVLYTLKTEEADTTTASCDIADSGLETASFVSDGHFTLQHSLFDSLAETPKSLAKSPPDTNTLADTSGKSLASNIDLNLVDGAPLVASTGDGSNVDVAGEGSEHADKLDKVDDKPDVFVEKASDNASAGNNEDRRSQSAPPSVNLDKISVKASTLLPVEETSLENICDSDHVPVVSTAGDVSLLPLSQRLKLKKRK